MKGQSHYKNISQYAEKLTKGRYSLELVSLQLTRKAQLTHEKERCCFVTLNSPKVVYMTLTFSDFQSFLIRNYLLFVYCHPVP